MKKEIAIGLIVTVVGGVLVYWFTQGVEEERRQKREQQQHIADVQREVEREKAKALDEEAHRPRMSAPEFNIDRPHNDYKDFVAQDLNACLKACENEKQCLAVTFDKSSRQCWMKNTVPLRADNPRYISAVKVGASP